MVVVSVVVVQIISSTSLCYHAKNNNNIHVNVYMTVHTYKKCNRYIYICKHMQRYKIHARVFSCVFLCLRMCVNA